MFSLSELLPFLQEKGIVTPDQPQHDVVLTGFTPISNAVEGKLTWMKNQALEWDQVHSPVIICGMEAPIPADHPSFYIPVDHPRLVFAMIVDRFYPKKTRTGIDSTAIIGDNCQIGEEVYIAPHCFIGDNVVIGNGTVIHPNVTIYADTRIGKNVIIHSGTVIGADGFGYEKNDQGEFIKFPHIGGVEIEDDVEIGANTCIDRGTLSNTYIGRNVKIDNLCHIAHNVQVGENSVVIALSMIGGSTKIGRNSWIAPSTTVKNGITIHDDTLVGLGAVVLKNVEAGDVVAGVPAKSIKKR